MPATLFWECLLRIFLAALCGLVIGFERKARLKEAGVRTHLIVALGAALITIVSKYGFFDLALFAEGIKADPTRIAAQIVSGVGFLGAGMIFMRHRTLTGLHADGARHGCGRSLYSESPGRRCARCAAGRGCSAAGFAAGTDMRRPVRPVRMVHLYSFRRREDTQGSHFRHVPGNGSLFVCERS